MYKFAEVNAYRSRPRDKGAGQKTQACRRACQYIIKKRLSTLILDL